MGEIFLHSKRGLIKSIQPAFPAWNGFGVQTILLWQLTVTTC